MSERRFGSLNCTSSGLGGYNHVLLKDGPEAYWDEVTLTRRTSQPAWFGAELTVLEDGFSVLRTTPKRSVATEAALLCVPTGPGYYENLSVTRPLSEVSRFADSEGKVNSEIIEGEIVFGIKGREFDLLLVPPNGSVFATVRGAGCKITNVGWPGQTQV